MTQRVALVTGAMGGLGTAICQELAKAGHKVVAADKIHNMRSIVEEYYDDHSSFLSHFGTHIEDRMLVYQEISNVLNRGLKNNILAEFNSVFTEYENFLHDVEKKRNEF